MNEMVNVNDECPCDNGKLADSNEENVTVNSPDSMVNTQIVVYDDGKSFVDCIEVGKVEKVDPFEYYKAAEIRIRAMSVRDRLAEKNPILAAVISDDDFLRWATELLEEEKYGEIKEKTSVHENYLRLLTTTRKKDQESLLKGMSLNMKQLYALFFKAYDDYGYLYSMYRFDCLPSDLKNKTLPTLSHISDESVVTIVEDTDMTKGEVKTMLVQKNAIIAHFLEKDEAWHCFFATEKGLYGKENRGSGHSHIHYISNAFSVSKEDCIECMKAGKYKASSIHITLLD